MANTNVFRGSDGAIMLAVDAGAEGDLAKGVIEAFSLTPVGRATNVEVRVDSDLRPFHELKLLLGDAAASRPAGTFLNPSFNIALRLENPAKPGAASTVTVHGAKLEHWSYGIPEDDFVMERVNFKALWVSVEDEEAA
jgi:hypothetical protein